MLQRAVEHRNGRLAVDGVVDGDSEARLVGRVDEKGLRRRCDRRGRDDQDLFRSCGGQVLRGLGGTADPDHDAPGLLESNDLHAAISLAGELGLSSQMISDSRKTAKPRCLIMAMTKSRRRFA